MRPILNDREIFLLTLKALGGVQDVGLDEQIIAIGNIISRLDEIQQDLLHKQQIQEAKRTADKRHQPGTREWGSHMSHCYDLNWEDNDGSRFACKYGDDDRCPAAMYEEPYKEWLKSKGVEE